MKVGISAIKGNISKTIASALYNNNLFDLSSALIREGYDEVNMDIGEFLGFDKTKTYITDKINDFVKNSDVIIDFSSRELTLKLAKEVSLQNKTLITGTRNLNEDDIEQIKSLSNNCKIIYSENMSISYNLFLNLIKDMAIFLRDDYLINVITSNNSATDIAKNIAFVKGWNNVSNNKESNNFINFSSIINKNSNYSEILFTSSGEEISIKQSIFNPKCIINGIIRAIIWSDGKDSGFYSMQDVLK